jgi:hypothetical protein
MTTINPARKNSPKAMRRQMLQFGLDAMILLLAAYLTVWFFNIPRESDIRLLLGIWATWKPLVGVVVVVAAAAIVAAASIGAGVKGFLPNLARWFLLGVVALTAPAIGYYLTLLQPLAANVCDYARQAAEVHKKAQQADERGVNEFRHAYERALANATGIHKQEVEEFRRVLRYHEGKIQNYLDARAAERDRTTEKQLDTWQQTITARGKEGIEAVRKDIDRTIEGLKNNEPEANPARGSRLPETPPDLPANPLPADSRGLDIAESVVKLRIAGVILAVAPELAPILGPLLLTTLGVNEGDCQQIADALYSTLRGGRFWPEGFKQALTLIDCGGQSSPREVYMTWGVILRRIKGKSSSPQFEESLDALERRTDLLADPDKQRIFRALGFQNTIDLIVLFKDDARTDKKALLSKSREFLLAKREVKPDVLRAALRFYLKEKLHEPDEFLLQLDHWPAPELTQ